MAGRLFRECARESLVSGERFPPAVKSVLSTLPLFSSAELVDAFLERQVDLGTSGRASQTDLLAIIALEQRIAVLAVEGKVDEPFGETVSTWVKESNSKRSRLEKLCHDLRLSVEQALPLHYQLLHRTCSAIYEARRYRTNLAIMIVHSFSKKQTGFAEFREFVTALGIKTTASPSPLLGPVERQGVSLYLGWAQDEVLGSETPEQFYCKLKEFATHESDRFARHSGWCDLSLGKSGQI